MIELHGPSRHPLPFRWYLWFGEWRRDEPVMVPLDIPPPVPDLSPAEEAAIRAAELKRERKNAKKILYVERRGDTISP